MAGLISPSSGSGAEPGRRDDPREAVLLVIAGPAGSGKSTLCDRVVQEVPGFSRVITATTRPPRSGECNGVHYHFLRPEEFDEKVAAGAFLEWAWVHKKHRYGTLASSVMEPLSRGGSLIINVDVQGVQNFRRAGQANPLLARHMAEIFISVSLDELRRRMISRGQDLAAEIAHRLETAERELLEAEQFDFRIESKSREDDFSALLAILAQVRQRLRSTI
jgi:guanylate kinase